MNWTELTDLAQSVAATGSTIDWTTVVGSNSLTTLGGQALTTPVNTPGTDYHNGSGSTFDIASRLTTPGNDVVVLTAEEYYAREVSLNTPALVYTILLLIIGLPGNFVVLYVYTEKWGRSSTRTFILGLAILDLVNCLVTYPMEIALLTRPLLFDFPVLCKVTRFTTYWCNTASVLILIAIAVDRYQRICRPLSKPMTTRTAKFVIFYAMGVAVVSMWPALVLYGTKSTPVSRTVVSKLCQIQDNFHVTVYPLVFFVLHGVCTVIIFLILTVIYLLVGIKVCKLRTFRSKSCSVTSISEFADEDDQLYLGNCKGAKNSELELQPLKGQKNKRPENGSKDDIPPAPGAIKVALKTTSDTLKKAQKSVTDKRFRRVSKTTIMLFLVTLMYVICFLPFLGIVFHRTIHKDAFMIMTRSEKMAFNVILRSYLLSCAINPIIYSFCSELFRKECTYLFKKLFRIN
ncbi:neuropeptide S receptor-like [Crassostrea angulata]|uniref:neuropeptide S receptor-like n=1 Tax=Magallana angulata TaxID=2784310 RepID=UPI0022B08360|nr:neuropeptide S receptor-like [Crassostrea angulata]